FLTTQDNIIRSSTQDLATANDNAQRAKALTSRGAAYSEKARFRRVSKSITTEEYETLFNLAMQDHKQAVALAPGNPEVYFNRAQANYDRGSGDLMDNKDGKIWFAAAALDFEKSIEL